MRKPVKAAYGKISMKTWKKIPPGPAQSIQITAWVGRGVSQARCDHMGYNPFPRGQRQTMRGLFRNLWSLLGLKT